MTPDGNSKGDMELFSPKAMIFDFDGVLADSVDVKAEGFSKIFEAFGSDVQEQVIQYHLLNPGLDRFRKIRAIYSEVLNRRITTCELENLAECFSKCIVQKVIDATPVGGSIEFLERWHRRALLFVVSATPDTEILKIVEARGLSKYFKEVLGSEKNKSENVKFLMENYRFCSNECVYFGDSIKDYEAANSNGVYFIGIDIAPQKNGLNSIPGIEVYRNFFEVDHSTSNWGVP
jgi:phosphoglycolate phosphatase-like HAD superfamily hydrolase